ncbi:AAA-family ATPase [Aureococcus anophagefferens]|nr:AAA-family ATPase [Aureococcus anophagefferens]
MDAGHEAQGQEREAGVAARGHRRGGAARERRVYKGDGLLLDGKLDDDDGARAPRVAGARAQRRGLEEQLDAIVRRVLASRGPEGARRLGVSHVRGVLLSGPPGCGKTLLARELARELGARAPRSSTARRSRQVRRGRAEGPDLFQPAEDEYRQVGDASALHVIVFDEMDAIARRRGSLTGDTTGVRDGVVNQLLAKLDGVVAAPNVLVVGCTNRPELIDEALLRPGRLEIQLVVDRPDAAGRRAIARIHTRQMRENGALAADAAALVEDGGASGLAARTELFSGAELAGRAPRRHALQRPEHGGGSRGPSTRRSRGGRAVAARAGNRSLLLVPDVAGCGATALASKAARDAVRDERAGAAELASADDLLRDGARPARRSPRRSRRPRRPRRRSSCSTTSTRWWAATGALAVLRALCRRPPPPGNRLLVLATAAAPGVDAALDACFDEVLRVPRLGGRDDAAEVLGAAGVDVAALGDVPDAPAPIKRSSAPRTPRPPRTPRTPRRELDFGPLRGLLGMRFDVVENNGVSRRPVTAGD